MPREQVAATQRDRLYDGLVRTVAERGYANASVSDICRASGVTRPAFYEHFESKQGAFLERRAFRHWRRTRPFWGGLLVLLGGGEELALYRASMKATLHMGLYGIGGYLVPVLLVVLGLSLIFDPMHHTFYSVLSLLFAVASWMTSNLGGFMLGMLLTMVGASLAFGWTESQQPEEAAQTEADAQGLPTS